jgi:hypothetical protein
MFIVGLLPQLIVESVFWVKFQRKNSLCNAYLNCFPEWHTLGRQSRKFIHWKFNNQTRLFCIYLVLIMEVGNNFTVLGFCNDEICDKKSLFCVTGENANFNCIF